MKLLLAIFIFSFTLGNFAAPYSDSEIQQLTSDICSKISTVAANKTKDSGKVFQATVAGFLGVKNGDKNNKHAVTNFWNQYAEKMSCTVAIDDLPTPQHILKRVIELNLLKSFYYDFFLKDIERKVNFVEMIDGNPETLLDYMDKVVAQPNADSKYNVADIKNLRNVLVVLKNAKHAAAMDF